MVSVVESRLHWYVHWFAGWGDSGFFGALGNVTWLTEIEARVFLDYVNTEEGLEVVRFCYGVTRLENVAEFLHGGLWGRSDGEVVDMETKVDAFAVGIEPIKETGIVHGVSVFV